MYDDRRRRSISPRRYNDRDNRVDPFKEEYLLEFRDYSQYLSTKHSKRFDQEELEKRYEAYKVTFSKTQNERLFTKWREEEWFQLRYHPSKSIVLKQQTWKRKEREFESFLEYMEKGSFQIGLDEQPTDPVLALQERKTLFIKGINDNIKREDIIKVLVFY
jgi:hypothetical protein